MALKMLRVCVPVLQIVDQNKPYNLQTDKSSHSPELCQGREKHPLLMLAENYFPEKKAMLLLRSIWPLAAGVPHMPVWDQTCGAD